MPVGTLSFEKIMLDPWYVTGFCDGEAAFTYSRLSGGSFSLYFSIKQREDNRQIIEEIHQYFRGAGKIYYAKESLFGKRSGYTRPAVYYRISRIAELVRMIAHFDKYPLQSEKKRKAYNIWREMTLHKFMNYRDADYDKMRAFAEELSALNAKTRVFKKHLK